MWKLSFLFAVVANANPSWEAWKAAHGRNYLTAQEEAFRHSVFTKNMATAVARNEIEEFATFGADDWSDWTEEEFLSLCGYIPQEDANIPVAPRLNVTDPPTAKDWTDTATTPVKNQGHCGSCWAFSATEQLESDYILQTGKKSELAPQELVDCKADKSQRNGCNGGFPSAAYDVVEALGGMEAEPDYPYQGRNQRCQFQKDKAKITITAYQSVGKGDENEMKKYVGSTGPLSVCGSAASWSGYHGGILKTCKSGGGHCFQIVGYGTENGVEYWKVRNSWGTSFGEQGFIRIEMHKNLCGIAMAPTKVTAKDVDETVVV